MKQIAPRNSEESGTQIQSKPCLGLCRSMVKNGCNLSHASHLTEVISWDFKADKLVCLNSKSGDFLGWEGGHGAVEHSTEF